MLLAQRRQHNVVAPPPVIDRRHRAAGVCLVGLEPEQHQRERAHGIDGLGLLRVGHREFPDAVSGFGQKLGLAVLIGQLDALKFLAAAIIGIIKGRADRRCVVTSLDIGIDDRAPEDADEPGRFKMRLGGIAPVVEGAIIARAAEGNAEKGDAIGAARLRFARGKRGRRGGKKTRKHKEEHQAPTHRTTHGSHSDRANRARSDRRARRLNGG